MVGATIFFFHLCTSISNDEFLFAIYAIVEEVEVPVEDLTAFNVSFAELLSNLTTIGIGSGMLCAWLFVMKLELGGAILLSGSSQAISTI